MLLITTWWSHGDENDADEDEDKRALCNGCVYVSNYV